MGASNDSINLECVDAVPVIWTKVGVSLRPGPLLFDKEQCIICFMVKMDMMSVCVVEQNDNKWSYPIRNIFIC